MLASTAEVRRSFCWNYHQELRVGKFNSAIEKWANDILDGNASDLSTYIKQNALEKVISGITLK